jgi:hypothetical protein
MKVGLSSILLSQHPKMMEERYPNSEMILHTQDASGSPTGGILNPIVNSTWTNVHEQAIVIGSLYLREKSVRCIFVYVYFPTC